jgi:hypothetical protein
MPCFLYTFNFCVVVRDFSLSDSKTTNESCTKTSVLRSDLITYSVPTGEVLYCVFVRCNF